MPNKQTKFHGILAVGRTKAEASNNYRLLAMNKGATVQVDGERNIAFVAQASSADGMFNPMSGNMDLETDDTFIDQLEFNSNSSAVVEVNHLVCKSGCLAHVIFDSESLVKYCPHCTSSLSEDDSTEEDEAEPEVEDDSMEAEAKPEEDEAEPEEDEAEPEEDEAEPEEDEAEPEEDEAEPEEDEAEAEPEEDEELPDLTEDDGDIIISSDDSDDDKIVVVAASLEEATELFRKHQPTTSLSSVGKIEVSYHLCSNSACGAHILASADVEECPACDSPVVEPVSTPNAKESVESVESSDDESEDESEDDSTLSLTNEDGSVLDEDTEELDAMDDMDEEESEESDSSAKLDVSYSSSVAGQARWTAFYNGTPVAMASKSSAGKNADIFDTPSFGHATLATAKVSGVRKALNELGFESIKHRVSVSKAVRNMVDAQVAETKTAIASEQQQFKDRFMAAIATASIGLNRGFYADKKNPVKAAMWNAMSSAGIRNPESLIDTAFKNHADSYHKTLFEIASDLTSKSADVQESLSKAIAGMSYMEASTSASDESIEGRLEQFGTSISSEVVKDQPVAPSSVGRQNISAAVRSLGRGR